MDEKEKIARKLKSTKKFIVLLVLIGIALALSAQINFSFGCLAEKQKSASETWSGEINRTTDYTVEEGNTLTILPGTIVRLGENVNIVVKGTLKAEGSENSAITITRLGNASYWGELYFDTTSTDSQLKYCYIEWGYIYCYFSAPTVSYCTISNMHTQCVYAFRCTLNISHTTIFSPENCGVYVSDATIIASYNKIYDQPATAIYCDGSLGNILYNDLSGPGCGIACHHSSPNVTNNHVHDCNWGIYVRYSDSSPVILYNDITNNQEGVKCYLKPSPKINYNNIQGNRDWGVVSEENIPTAFYSVDAKNNYWGASNGPSGQGSGSGDKASRNVDYSPYLTEKVVVGVEPPNASFAYSFTSDLGNQTIQFTDASTDDIGIVSWYWDFGDGNTSTEQSPKHTYLL